MPKKLLLVDDEEFFLKSLKDGLEPLIDVFETDICHSVNEAIKHVVTTRYDLVITDIRMPGKTGVDLLIYLRDMRFDGKVMVMSAYSTDESSNKIKALGVVDVIAKPFKLGWFKDMLLEWFAREKDRRVTFESIDLVTVMQILNLEKKTSALQVDIDDERGMIFFEDGEIIHAEYAGIEGEEAVLRLIALNKGAIAVKQVTDLVKRTMTVPFVEYMMNIMKTIDEVRRDRRNPINAVPVGDEPPKKENRAEQQQKEVIVAINEILKTLNDVNGFLGSGVFTPQGELLEGTTEVSGIHFEEAGSMIHDALANSKQVSRTVGFGDLNMMQFYTDMGIIFAKCYNDGKLHFHTILVIKTDGNVAMARMKMDKVVDALKEVL